MRRRGRRSRHAWAGRTGAARSVWFALGRCGARTGAGTPVWALRCPRTTPNGPPRHAWAGPTGAARSVWFARAQRPHGRPRASASPTTPARTTTQRAAPVRPARRAGTFHWRAAASCSHGQRSARTRPGATARTLRDPLRTSRPRHGTHRAKVHRPACGPTGSGVVQPDLANRVRLRPTVASQRAPARCSDLGRCSRRLSSATQPSRAEGRSVLDRHGSGVGELGLQGRVGTTPLPVGPRVSGLGEPSSDVQQLCGPVTLSGSRSVLAVAPGRQCGRCVARASTMRRRGRRSRHAWAGRTGAARSVWFARALWARSHWRRDARVGTALPPCGHEVAARSKVQTGIGRARRTWATARVSSRIPKPGWSAGAGGRRRRGNGGPSSSSPRSNSSEKASERGRDARGLRWAGAARPMPRGGGPGQAVGARADPVGLALDVAGSGSGSRWFRRGGPGPGTGRGQRRHDRFAAGGVFLRRGGCARKWPGRGCRSCQPPWCLRAWWRG